jgi:hypothetical protein
MPMLLRTTIVAFAAATGAVAADAPPLTGMWGAGDATLALDAQGGRLQIGCTFALLSPVRQDASGRFTVDAKVQSLKVLLPEDDETEAAAVPARLSGQLGGGAVNLILTVQGQTPRQVQLIAGQRGKPARCL